MPRVTRPSAMAVYIYVLAETVDSYAPSVQAGGSVKIEGDILDTSASVVNLRLFRDRGYDLAAG